jgi:hypothetical protein
MRDGLKPTPVVPQPTVPLDPATIEFRLADLRALRERLEATR